MKQKMNFGGGGAKRKTKESEEKNNKRPYRGTGVEQLERLRLQQKITYPHQPPPPHYFSSSFNAHNYNYNYFPPPPAPPILSSIPNYSAIHHNQKMGIYGGSKVIEVPKLHWNGLFVETIAGGVGNTTSTQEETGVMSIQPNNAGGGDVKAITIKFGNSKL